MLTLIFIFGLVALTSTTPILGRDDYASNPTSIFTPSPVTETTQLAGSPTDIVFHEPIVEGSEVPIDGASYFYVSNDCFTDKRNMDGSGFPNRGAFYNQAYKDATLIAAATSDWPQRNVEASNIYFGEGTEDPVWSKDIAENLRVAAHWDQKRFGFDNYIVLTCSDPFQACGGRIGRDPRSVACYVNNTKSWWWNKSYINCCAPYFTTESIDRQFTRHEHDDPNDLDLRYLQTSGSFLLHEMMHTLEITGTKKERPHLVDIVFDGSLGRRVYGPSDVARAARIMGINSTYLNADSYAQFASAIYWQKRFGGSVPRPDTANAAPEGYEELITDNDYNYFEPVRPPVPTDTSTAAGSMVTCC